MVAEDFVIGGEQDWARAEDVTEVNRDRVLVSALLNALEDFVAALLAYFGIAKDAVYNPKDRGDCIGDVVEDTAHEHAWNVLFGNM